jgi:hypothetical protein
MNELTTIDSTNIVAILKETGKIDISRPFGQKIYLIDTWIAGTTHVLKIKEIEPVLEIGMRLNFFREIDNKHDPLAIVVKDNLGNKLGYVPRAKNEILARLMDAGKLLYGEIHSKEFVGSWLKITMKIWLND